MRVKLSSIVMTAMLLGGGLVDQPCLACSCAGGWNFAGSAAPDGTAVFAGRVTSLDYTKDEVRNSLSVTLQVSRIWKGSRAPIHVVRTEPNGGCGFPFAEGKEYLVFAEPGEAGEVVGLCGFSRLLSAAGATLKALGDGEPPLEK